MRLKLNAVITFIRADKFKQQPPPLPQAQSQSSSQDYNNLLDYSRKLETKIINMGKDGGGGDGDLREEVQELRSKL